MSSARKPGTVDVSCSAERNRWTASISEETIMTQSSIIGLVALAVGIVLLFFAWRASNAPLEQVSEALTGRYSDRTMWFFVGGIIVVVAGAALLYRGLSRN
jgi:protein-S-isoprenylcysteine O-methyltransferase Ste14